MNARRISALQILKASLIFSAALSLLVYLWLASQRIPYPFELEWVEGGLADEVTQLLKTGHLYSAPSLEFTPFLYPPLYFYLSAGLAKLNGNSLLALRQVSFLASLAAFWAIFELVRRETRAPLMGLLAAGLFAAAYRVTGAWLDVARVDALFLALWLIFLLAAQRPASAGSALAAGTFATLAFLSKQTALIACAPIFVWLLWKNWKHGLATLGTALTLTGIISLALERTSGGWSSYYIYGLLFRQAIWQPYYFIAFWRDDLLIHLPVAGLLTAFFFGARPVENRRQVYFWIAVTIGGVTGAFLTRAKLGGYDNVLLPAYAAAAILFGLGLSELLQFLQKISAAERQTLQKLVYAACLLQFLLLAYNPYEQVPSAADRQAGQALLKLIASTPGEVYLPDHGYLASLAGKRSYSHQAAIADIVRGEQSSAAKTIVQQAFDDAIRQQKFDLIIFDSSWNYCCGDLENFYTQTGSVFADEEGFYPVTGARRRPTYIYTAKRLLP
ncbi:MAG: hypothetical protein OHK0031_02600 [Anaerolineales bacterium]